MSCTFKCTVAFALGATAGSIVAWKLLKTKYEQIAQEEIDSVKEVFARREKERKTVDEHEEIFTNDMVKEDVGNTEQEIDDYNDLVANNSYTNYSDISKKVEKKEEKRETVNKPYVISPNDFGMLDDYEIISLTYYADHVLTDEDDDIVENVEDVVGFESLTHFGEYEDDSVFVRNDTLKCDYEILYDTRKYSDVIRKMPHRMED